MLGLVAIAGTGAMGRTARATTDVADRQGEAQARGNRLLLPALIIPATAAAGSVRFAFLPALCAP